MEEKKEVSDNSKVKAYNIKIKNIEKIEKIAEEKEGGNSSRALNKIIEAY